MENFESNEITRQEFVKQISDWILRNEARLKKNYGDKWISGGVESYHLEIGKNYIVEEINEIASQVAKEFNKRKAAKKILTGGRLTTVRESESEPTIKKTTHKKEPEENFLFDNKKPNWEGWKVDEGSH